MRKPRQSFSSFSIFIHPQSTSSARFTWESDSSGVGCGSKVVESHGEDDTKMGSVVVIMKMETMMTMKMMEVIMGVVHFV